MGWQFLNGLTRWQRFGQFLNEFLNDFLNDFLYENLNLLYEKSS